MKIIEAKVNEEGYIKLFLREEDVVVLEGTENSLSAGKMITNESKIRKIKAIIPYKSVYKEADNEIYFKKPNFDYRVSVRGFNLNGEKYFISKNSIFNDYPILGGFKEVFEDFQKILGVTLKMKDTQNSLESFLLSLLQYSELSNFTIVSKDVLYFADDNEKDAYKLFLTNPERFVSDAFYKKHKNANCPILDDKELDRLQSNTTLYRFLIEHPESLYSFLQKKYKLEEGNVNILRIFIDTSISGNLTHYTFKQAFADNHYMEKYYRDSENISEIVFPKYNRTNISVEDKTKENISKAYNIPFDSIYKNRIPFDKIRHTLIMLRQNTILENMKIDCSVY